MDFGSFILCGIFFICAFLCGMKMLLGRMLFALPVSPRLKRFFLVSAALFVGSYLFNYKVFYLDEGLACSTAPKQTPTALRLMRLGADPDAATEGGITVLMGAIGNENTELVKALIAKGADVNKPAVTFFDGGNMTHTTPMKAALKRKNPQIIQALRDAGARP